MDFHYNKMKCKEDRRNAAEAYEDGGGGAEKYEINLMAEIPLNPGLFPHAGHHFYKDGLLFSDMPQNSTISSTTWNIKNVPGEMENFSIQTKETFDQLMRQFNL